jgi:hypothetical protein
VSVFFCLISLLLSFSFLSSKKNGGNFFPSIHCVQTYHCFLKKKAIYLPFFFPVSLLVESRDQILLSLSSQRNRRLFLRSTKIKTRITSEGCRNTTCFFLHKFINGQGTVSVGVAFVVTTH